MLAHLARHGTCPVAAPCPAGVPHYITQITAHQEMGIFTCSCVQGVLFSALTIQQQPGDAKPKKETSPEGGPDPVEGMGGGDWRA